MVIRPNNIPKINENSNHKDYLKYYRLKEKLTYNSLAEKINYNAHDLKRIELGNKEITRDISQRLASYFKLDTTYFYNEYYEETHNFHEIYIKYLENNKMSELSRITNINYSILRSWKKEESRPNYNHYLILKEHGIL